MSMELLFIYITIITRSEGVLTTNSKLEARKLRGFVVIRSYKFVVFFEEPLNSVR